MRPAAAFGVAAMVGWGIAYVPSAWLVERWPPLVAAGARLTLAGVVLLGALALSGRALRPGAGPVTIGWLALTQTVFFYGATYWGIAHGGAGLAAVLANTDPLFVAVLAAAFLGERLEGRQWAASRSAWWGRRWWSGRGRSGRRRWRPGPRCWWERRGGLHLVLPGAGHRGRERVAAPRGGAPGASPGGPGGGLVGLWLVMSARVAREGGLVDSAAPP